MKSYGWILVTVVFLLVAIFPAESSLIPRMPAGTILMSAAPSCPAGTVPADHANLLRTSYPNLFAALCPGGTCTAWGNADGTHFYAPDLRNRFLRGTGTNYTGGGTTVALGGFQDSETAVGSLSVITHTTGVYDSGHNHTIPLAAGGDWSFGGNNWSVNNTASNISTGSGSATIQDPGHVHSLSGGTETRPKTIGVLHCIWY